MAAFHIMKFTLFTLAFILYVSSAQYGNCSDADDYPLTETKCNDLEPLSGDCCECHTSECEGCVPTECDSDEPTQDPTEMPTLNPTTSEPSASPTAIPLVCGDAYDTYVSWGESTLFTLSVSDTVDVLILSLCDESTSFNTSLTLFDDEMNQIAHDDNGCNDDVGRSRIRLDGIEADDYFILVASPFSPHEDRFILSVECNTFSPTTQPTQFPVTQAPVTATTMTTNTGTPCIECPYNVSLIAIANITIEECPEDTPTPTVWSQSGHKPHKQHHRRKLSSVEAESERRRLWGGYEPQKPWNEHKTPSPTPWMADRVCIERDEYHHKRRLWGWKAPENDGCDDDKRKPKPTPAPTPSGFIQWYKEKCHIKEYKGWSHSYSTSTYGHHHGKHGYGERYTSWSKRHDQSDEFLTEVCVTYSIASDIDDDDAACGEVDSVFLGICENNNTDFNSSTLTADDLTDLIVSINNNSDENIQSATGAEHNDALGILVVFADDHQLTEFELCLGNVTVDTDFNDERDNIDVGEGIITIDDTYVCDADGLPCLNFFFDVECPPETTVDSSCECVGGMTSLTLLYAPSNDLNASIIGYYDAKRTNDVFCEFSNVAPGTEIECASDDYEKLSSRTYFAVHYKSDTSRRRLGRRGNGGTSHGGKSHGGKGENDIDIGDCSGKFDTSCDEQIVGTTAYGCDDLTAVAFVAVDGMLCNQEILDDDEDIYSANALIGDRSHLLESPLKVLEELDPYVRYSLIGVLVTFVGLTAVACCICVRRNPNDRKKVSVHESMSEMRRHLDLQERTQTLDGDGSDADSLVEMTTGH